MSADVAGYDNAAESAGVAFQPSAGLRAQLLLGMLAMTASGALGVGSMLSMDVQAQGWTVSTIMDLASIVPLAMVLWCYLRLAKEVGSIGLRRGSLGMLGVFMLMPVLGLSDPLLVGDVAAIVIGVTVALLGVSLIVAISHRPAWANAAANEGDTATAKASWGGLGTLGILAFIGVRLLLRGRKRWFNNNLGDEWPGLLLVLALVILLLVFVVVSGIVKLRLGRRLGLSSVLLGLVELGLLILILVVFGLFAGDFLVAVENAGPEDPDGEAAAKAVGLQWMGTLVPVGVGVQGLWTIMTALFFWTVRGNADPEPDPLA